MSEDQALRGVESTATLGLRSGVAAELPTPAYIGTDVSERVKNVFQVRIRSSSSSTSRMISGNNETINPRFPVFSGNRG